jgi:hypothetical protein
MCNNSANSLSKCRIAALYQVADVISHVHNACNNLCFPYFVAREGPVVITHKIIYIYIYIYIKFLPWNIMYDVLNQQNII